MSVSRSRTVTYPRTRPLVPGNPALVAGWFTVLMVLTVYLLTLAPSVVGGDAGELVAGTASGGVLHPPGYPLYALLGRIFLLLPIGEPAWRMNLFSMVAGVAAAWMLQRATARWSGSPWAGVLAAACFAFCPVVWEHSVGAEVFALHHVFVAALLWVAVAYAETGAARWVWIGAGVTGLAMSHHHTIVFFAAPLAVWPLIRQPSYWLKPTRLAGLAGVLLLGLLPYAFLPAASSSAAPVSWGDWTTPEGAWKHFTRADYGTMQLASGEVASAGGWTTRLAAWGRFEAGALGWFGVPVALSGLVAACKSPRWRVFALGTAVTFLLYVLAFNFLANLSPASPLFRSVLVRFWTAPHLLACAWLGLGWAHWMKGRPRLLSGGVIGITLGLVLLHWKSASRRGATEFSNYGGAWLEPLPPSAVLLARGDLIMNTAGYRQVCTGFRKDVRLLDLERMTYAWHTRALARRDPSLVLPGSHYQPGIAGCYDLNMLIEANPDLGPWFVAGDLTPVEIDVLRGWTLLPHGLGWRMVPPDKPIDFVAWWNESDHALPKFDPPSRNRRKADPWAASVAADFHEARNRRGVTTLEIAGRQGNSPELLRLAIGVFQNEAGRADAPARVFKNLGIAWQRLEGRDPSATDHAKKAWRRFLDLDDGSDPDIGTIRRWLEGR
ncbi:MAG: DUF2723 domain-containing protein [Akkermansiaceae bacterium]|nr:DUF2723 domain-containing protein [Akkermansiaceae bacterium]